MNLDEIIQRTLKKMADDYEVRRSLYLSTIYKSIDSLIEGSPVWFGDNPPASFRLAIRQLMELSASVSEQIQDFNDFIFSREREVVDTRSFLETVSRSARTFSPDVSISVDGDPDASIFVPSAAFRDTLMNLLVCVLQFATQETSVSLRSEKVLSSVRIVIDAVKLSPETPELAHLMKPVLASLNGRSYRFRIGLELPLYDLKKIGGVADLESRNGGRELLIVISLPSYSFLQTVESIRLASSETPEKREGDIVVSVEDPMLSLILREKLGENGYSVRSYAGERIRFLPAGTYKAMIVDADKIARGLIGEREAENGAGNSRIIVICGESDAVTCSGTSYRIVPMPFDIDQIMGFIES